MDAEGRRGFERFTSSFPTKFKNRTMNVTTPVVMKDFSASGARLHINERLSVDDVLSLEVELPDGHGPLGLNGRVRWIKSRSHDMYQSGWDVGVEFHRVDLMNLHRLMRFATEVEKALT
jgi:hypothetical protein